MGDGQWEIRESEIFASILLLLLSSSSVFFFLLPLLLFCLILLLLILLLPINSPPTPFRSHSQSPSHSSPSPHWGDVSRHDITGEDEEGGGGREGGSEGGEVEKRVEWKGGQDGMSWI